MFDFGLMMMGIDVVWFEVFVDFIVECVWFVFVFGV